MSKQTSITPGPWSAHKYPDVKSWTVAGAQSVASKIKTEEDALLISAAPELLELVKVLVNVTVNGVDPNSFSNIRNQALQAIAKAEGRK